MMRGARSITIPPLHNFGDVLGLLLFALLLLFVIMAVFDSGPLPALFRLLSAPNLVTLLELQVGLVATPELCAELGASLPVQENAARSIAVDLARDVSNLLLRHRSSWQSVALRARQVRDTDSLRAWNQAWQLAGRETTASDAPEHPGEAGVGSELVVTILVLITNRSPKMPKRLTVEALALLLNRLASLDFQLMGGFAALYAPGRGAMSSDEVHADYPRLLPI